MTKFKILLILLVALSPSVAFAAADDDFFESQYNTALIGNGQWFWQMKIDEILLTNDSNHPPEFNYSDIRFGPLSAGAWGGAYSAGKSWKYIIPPDNLTTSTEIYAHYWLVDESGAEIPDTRARVRVTFVVPESNGDNGGTYTPPGATDISAHYGAVNDAKVYANSSRQTESIANGWIQRSNGIYKQISSGGAVVVGFSDQSPRATVGPAATHPLLDGRFSAADVAKLSPTSYQIYEKIGSSYRPVTLEHGEHAPAIGSWVSLEGTGLQAGLHRFKVFATYHVPDDGKQYYIKYTWPLVSGLPGSLADGYRFRSDFLTMSATDSGAELESDLDAIDDAYTGVKNKKLTMPVKSNDIGAEYATLTIATQPNEGTVSKATSDELEFTPPTDWTGTTSFTYTITDDPNSDTATVTITIPDDEPSDEECDPCEYLKRIADALDPPSSGGGNAPDSPALEAPILPTGSPKEFDFGDTFDFDLDLPSLDNTKFAPSLELYIPWVGDTTKIFTLSPDISQSSLGDYVPAKLRENLGSFFGMFRFIVFVFGFLFVLRKIFNLAFKTV